MSDAPKAHVYKPTTPEGHCADCGHNIVASWHYVEGKKFAALERELAEAQERSVSDLAHGNSILLWLGLSGQSAHMADVATIAAHAIDKLKRALAEARGALKVQSDELDRIITAEHRATTAESSLAALRQELKVAEGFHGVAVKERNAAWNELTTLREGHAEAATLMGRACVLMTLDPNAGERPSVEPDHALTSGVWRMVQERAILERALAEARVREADARRDHLSAMKRADSARAEAEQAKLDTAAALGLALESGKARDAARAEVERERLERIGTAQANLSYAEANKQLGLNLSATREQCKNLKDELDGMYEREAGADL